MSKLPKNASSSRSLRESFSRALVYAPILIAILLMLPRLVAPQFGLFDDGRTLVTAEKISHGTWYTGQDSLEGRFRPMHWLWFTLSYLIGGKSPFWFYAANTLALVLIVAAMILLVRAIGGSSLQAFLAGLFFVLAGPVVESFLTLKGEVFQLTLMLFSLLAALLYKRARTRGRKAGVVGLTTALLLLADMTKETAIVLLPISLAWYLLARFWPSYIKDPAQKATRRAYLLANLLAVPLFFLARTAAFSAQISTGTYSGQYAFQAGQIAVSALRWAGWLVRDFTWVLPLTLLVIVLAVSQRRLNNFAILVDSFIWMGAWVCVYLPWNFMAEYYMLPFALGGSIFASALIGEIAPALSKGGRKQWMTSIFIVVSGILMIGHLFNNLTNARIQLTVDSANAKMMKFLAQQTESDSNILVNIQLPNEYFYEMQTQLKVLYDRPDLNVLMFRPDMSLPSDGKATYIVSPFVKNEPLLTVRMGVIENSQRDWNTTLQGFFQTKPGSPIVYDSNAGFRLSNVDYPRIFCPLIKTRLFCAVSAPLVDTRPFDYGWKAYKLINP
jgi:hypothetical protein